MIVAGIGRRSRQLPGGGAYSAGGMGSAGVGGIQESDTNPN